MLISEHHRVIFNFWPPEPVYHGPLIGPGLIWRVACGRVIDYSTPMLPTRHVKKFARPCKSCFPGGDA